MQLLYLGRRDKSSVQIIGLIWGSHSPCEPVQIDNLKEYLDRIPADFYGRILSIQQQKRMDWQLYVENFEDIQDFEKKLKARGYKSIPAGVTPLVYSSRTQIIDAKPPTIKTMVQKKT